MIALVKPKFFVTVFVAGFVIAAVCSVISVDDSAAAAGAGRLSEHIAVGDDVIIGSVATGTKFVSAGSGAASAKRSPAVLMAFNARAVFAGDVTVDELVVAAVMEVWCVVIVDRDVTGVLTAVLAGAHALNVDAVVEVGVVFLTLALASVTSLTAGFADTKDDEDSGGSGSRRSDDALSTSSAC